MTKIEEIEKLLEEWEAAMGLAERHKHTEAYCMAKGGVSTLKAALAIFTRPSNTRMHVDTKPTCPKKDWHGFYAALKYKFCPECGNRL